jgi:DNA-binding transcriptional regulator GbsR (MarR family)
VSDSLREAELLSADAIGEVIEHWGFRKPLGRVWAVLYLQADPLSASDIAERLSMSAGSVSTTVAELQRWGVEKR